MAKKKFRVPVKFEVNVEAKGFITVEADTEENAILNAEKTIENIGLTCEAIRNNMRDNNSLEVENASDTAYEYLKRGYMEKFSINTDYTEVWEIEDDD